MCTHIQGIKHSGNILPKRKVFATKNDLATVFFANGARHSQKAPSFSLSPRPRGNALHMAPMNEVSDFEGSKK
jgi:hypothetical protein